MEKQKFLAILALVSTIVVWQVPPVQASFFDSFDTPGAIAYTGSNSAGSGGSYTISGGKLNITTGNNNTFSVMTTEPVQFNIGDTLSLYVPGISGDQRVFMMCSTTALQPGGTASFGFRFERSSGGLMIYLFPESVVIVGYLEPAKPATLIVKRTSDTKFDFTVRVEGVKTNQGWFTLPNLSGIYALHIGAQAYNTSVKTFAFDNLWIQPPIHNITKDTWYDTIQESINDAENGDQIEVLPGLYFDSINFSGKAVRLYSSGGAAVTTINGNNAYHVVQCVNGEDANTILDGFTITGGNANGNSLDNRGGGMLNNNSSPTITNCTFSDNTAIYGGGMFNLYGSPTVTNCTFISNESVGHGGGMLNNYSSPAITNCAFRNNTAEYGGGISNEASNPDVNNCTFISNESSKHGGGIHNDNSTPLVTNCAFSRNTTGLHGGGMYNNASNPDLNNCTFVLNESVGHGGGIMNNALSSTTVANCLFYNNTAGGGGGGIANDASNPAVNNCTFLSNESGEHGGGIHNENSAPLVTNCVFSQNASGLHGGGIMNNNSSNPTVVNCIFAYNTAGASGGGLANSITSHSIVANSSFYINAAKSGGGIYSYQSYPTIVNCILWYDTPDEVKNDDGFAVVTYSDIKGGYAGAGNINADPCWAGDDTRNFILYLKRNSPCIDSGDSRVLINTGISQDLAGFNRFVDISERPNTDTGSGTLSFVDMGACEFNYFTKKPLIANDANGKPVSFSLSGGGWGELRGKAGFLNVFLYDTGEKSQLTISTKGKTETSIGGINCEGPLKGISAKNVNLLDGGIFVDGSLGTLVLNDALDNDAMDNDIIIGSSANPTAAVKMKFDRVGNLSINSGMPVKSVTTTDCLGGQIITPSLGSISIVGNRKLGISGDLDIDIFCGDDGVIGSVKAAGKISGYWRSKSVKSITCRNTDDLYLILAQNPDPLTPKILALGKITVNENFDWSRILSSGDIGTITAGKIRHSSIFAGVSESCTQNPGPDGVFDLPEAVSANFPQNATIKSIAIKGVKGDEFCFINSNIAAANILNASLAYPQYDNTGVPFGIAADYIKKLTIKDDAGTHNLKELDKPADIPDEIDLIDAQIRLYEP